MSVPSPDERLRQRLAQLPDACRALLAALDRQASRGGGSVLVSLHVGHSGALEAVELTTRYVRIVDAAGKIQDGEAVRVSRLAGAAAGADRDGAARPSPRPQQRGR